MDLTRRKQWVDAGVEVVSGFSSSATNGARFRCSICLLMILSGSAAAIVTSVLGTWFALLYTFAESHRVSTSFWIDKVCFDQTQHFNGSVCRLLSVSLFCL